MLHHNYTRFVFFGSLIVGLIGSLLETLPWKLFFIGYASYGILCVPVTLRTRGKVPTIVPLVAQRNGYNSDEYFHVFGGVMIPKTQSSAICTFQHLVICLLGVHWYKLDYGELIYCGGDMHTYREHQTLYNMLFIATDSTPSPVWYIPCTFIPHSSFIEELNELRGCQFYMNFDETKIHEIVSV